jgi:phosphomevalonate kinase
MKNSIIVIILIVFVGMVAYWYLGQTNGSTAYLASDVKTTDSVDAKYIYSILQKMAKVNLDDSIFSNTIFQNLRDNTVSFPPQASGRNNPFAPVGTDTNLPGQTTGTGTMPSSLNAQ